MEEKLGFWWSLLDLEVSPDKKIFLTAEADIRRIEFGQNRPYKYRES